MIAEAICDALGAPVLSVVPSCGADSMLLHLFCHLPLTATHLLCRSSTQLFIPFACRRTRRWRCGCAASWSSACTRPRGRRPRGPEWGTALRGPRLQGPPLLMCSSPWALAVHLLVRQRRPQVQRRQQTGALPAAAGGPGRQLSPRMQARPLRRLMRRMLMCCCHGARSGVLGGCDSMFFMFWDVQEVGMGQ